MFKYITKKINEQAKYISELLAQKQQQWWGDD